MPDACRSLPPIDDRQPARSSRRRSESLLPRLAVRQLESAGLSDVACRILADEELEAADLSRLARASLPLLGKLVELKSEPPVETALERTVFCPLASLLEERGLEAAIVHACEEIGKAAGSSAGPMYLVIDRWNGLANTGELANVLAALRARFGGKRLQVVASGAELALAVGSGLSADDLRTLAVCRIDSDRSALNSVGHLGIDILIQQSSLTGEPLIAELLEVRAFCYLSAWEPHLATPPDRSELAGGEPLGADVIRAVAIARLALPSRVEVRAPVAMLGPKLAQVALGFGATHLGPATVDARAAAALGIPTEAEIVHLIENDRPTSREVEPRPAPRRPGSSTGDSH